MSIPPMRKTIIPKRLRGSARRRRILRTEKIVVDIPDSIVPKEMDNCIAINAKMGAPITESAFIPILLITPRNNIRSAPRVKKVCVPARIRRMMVKIELIILIIPPITPTDAFIKILNNDAIRAVSYTHLTLPTN